MIRRHDVFTLVLGGLLLGTGCKKKPPESGLTVEDVAGTATTTTTNDAVGVPVIEQPWTPARINDEIDKAAALLTSEQESHAREALEILKDVSREAPDRAEVPYDMGVAYQIVGDENNARKSYLRATELDPAMGEAWLNLGAMSERQGQLTRALNSYQAGLRHAPENPDLIVGVIGVLRKLGRDDEAIARAKQALQTNANNINAYNNLGLVYMDQGKQDLALFIYQRALQFIDGADNNALLHCNIGRVYLQQDKRGAAGLEFERALELDPKLVAAMMFLAQISMDHRDWEKTAELLETARDLEPDNAAIRLNLGIAYRGLGRYEEAKRSYEKALDLDPQNLDPRLDLAVLLADSMQSYDLAIDQLQAYKREGGTRIEVADQWMSDIEDHKRKAKKAAERKKRQEEARRKREERQRLLQEEEERKAREAAEQAAQPPAAAQDAGTPPQEAATAPDGDGAGAPWGGATGQPPGGAGDDTSDAPQPAPTTPDAPQAERATTDAPQGNPAAPSSAGAAAGNACAGLGTCGDFAVECAHDAVCRPAGQSGTYGLGVGCVQDGDCAYGLSCLSNLCSKAGGEGGDPGTAAPWGGQQ